MSRVLGRGEPAVLEGLPDGRVVGHHGGTGVIITNHRGFAGSIAVAVGRAGELGEELEVLEVLGRNNNIWVAISQGRAP